jgi:hypothetical protein
VTDLAGPEGARLLRQAREQGGDPFMRQQVAAFQVRQGRRPSAVRSEPVTCPGCLEAGATAEESFLIHADPAPVAPPGPRTGAYGYGDYGAISDEAERLEALGYSRESALYAATPGREITR